MLASAYQDMMIRIGVMVQNEIDHGHPVSRIFAVNLRNEMLAMLSDIKRYPEFEGGHNVNG